MLLKPPRIPRIGTDDQTPQVSAGFGSRTNEGGRWGRVLPEFVRSARSRADRAENSRKLPFLPC